MSPLHALMYPNYYNAGAPSGSGDAGQPYSQWVPLNQQQLQLQPLQQQFPPMQPQGMSVYPPMQQPMVPPGYGEQYEQWPQWNSHFGAMNPTAAWRHQAAATMHPTPYDRPVTIQHQVPYGGRPYVPRDMSGPNANTVPTPLMPSSINKQQEPSSFFLRNNSSCLAFDVNVSSTRLDISWKKPRISGAVTYEMSIVEGGAEPWKFTFPSECTRHVMCANAGESYVISISARKEATGRIVARGQRTIKAIFSEAEFRQLYNNAVRHTGTNKMRPSQVMYRCKPKPYWDDLHHNCGEVMVKYLKDNNGQPANAINGVLSGLFFMVRLHRNGNLPSTSPFGNVRMIVPAFKLIDPNSVNLYFADFYCYQRVHYVTVVAAKKGTVSDIHSNEHLIPLDMRSNPWLICVESPLEGLMFLAAHSVWVEVFYTENIPLGWGRFDEVQAVGLGTSTIGGRINNKVCTECNLYPVAPSNVAIVDEAATEDTGDNFDENENDSASSNLVHVKVEEVKTPEPISPINVKVDDAIVEELPPEPVLPVVVVELQTCENQMPERREVEGATEEAVGKVEGEEEMEAETREVDSTLQTMLNLENVHDCPQWTNVIECLRDVVDGVVRKDEEESTSTISLCDSPVDSPIKEVGDEKNSDSSCDSPVEKAIERVFSYVEESEDEKIDALECVVRDLEVQLRLARQELAQLREARAVRDLATPTPRAPPILLTPSIPQASPPPELPMEAPPPPNSDHLGLLKIKVEDPDEDLDGTPLSEAPTTPEAPPSNSHSGLLEIKVEEPDECVEGEESAEAPPLSEAPPPPDSAHSPLLQIKVEVPDEGPPLLQAPPTPDLTVFEDTGALVIKEEEDEESTVSIEEEKEEEDTVDEGSDLSIDEDTVETRSNEDEDEYLEEEDTVDLKRAATDSIPPSPEPVKRARLSSFDLIDLTEEELLLIGPESCIEITPEMEEELLRDY